MSEPYDKIK